jgi:glycosyltransferase involved in cell wall biosynthesis
MKYKIINIMNHPPAYDEYTNKPKPAINWDIPDNNWVGIWGYDWSDLIGNEIIKTDPEIVYEVWQPDLRSDKVYSHSFNNRMSHSLFPAILILERRGFKKLQQIYSQAIINALQEFVEKNEKEYKLIIECGFGNTEFYKQIQKFKKRFPIVSQYTGHPYNITTLNWTFNPLKLIQRAMSLVGQLNSLLFTDFLIIGDYLQKESTLLRLLIRRKVFHPMIGIDKVYFGRIDKSSSRKALNIREDCFVMFMSSRLVNLKQIDRFIECCSNLKHNYNLIISGHGTREYETSLINLVSKYNLDEKIKFIGYVSDQTLVQYYSASDLFINSSRREGGPIAAWKALTMGIPVFTTNEGNVANYLKEQSSGCVVGYDDYNQWSNLLDKIISGEITLRSPAFENVHELVNWDNCAKKYIKIYTEIVEVYDKKN